MRCVVLDWFPDELDFISLFCVEPVKFSRNSSFMYNESRFQFDNGLESFIVKMLPSYGEFNLIVDDKKTKEQIAFYSFKTVEKLEIVSDTNNLAKILLILDDDRDRFITSVEITFKPKFSIILKEEFNE